VTQIVAYPNLEGAAMGEPVPIFFFSYSRADENNKKTYLDSFFRDLQKRVADLSGKGIAEGDVDYDEKLDQIGFRDKFGLKTGHDWRNTIGKAIQSNGVLVCLYSPNFFARSNPSKQFCGKEITAFLLRHPELKSPFWGKPLLGVTHILPILWHNETALKKENLPPESLSSITWMLGGSMEERLKRMYLEKGVFLLQISTDVAAYQEILNYLAERIIDIARRPLPTLPEPPDIENLPSIWENPDRDGSREQLTAASETPALQGPSLIQVIVLRRDVEDHWTPFGDDSLKEMFEEFVNRRAPDNRPRLHLEWRLLDPSVEGFVDETARILEVTRLSSGRPILVADPQGLIQDAARNGLHSLLRTRQRAALLIPAATGDPNSTVLANQYIDSLASTKSSGWILRTGIRDKQEFTTSVDSVCTDLLDQIVGTDEVKQAPPDNKGPAQKPVISNRQD
jgi:hypothetical protein